MDNRAKWTDADFRNPVQNWQPPPLVYPCPPSEKDALHALKNVFQPLMPYKTLEEQATAENAIVEIPLSVPDGEIAFLENTAEQCTSPQTKHSEEGMRGARHWVQRVDTTDGVFQRLIDGYGISLMVGERHHQYIRNSNNWRGVYGVQLDLDVWYQDPDALTLKLESDGRDADFIKKRLAENEKLPRPVYSQDELFDRYPLIPRICTYMIPSASSLYQGKPFKARGIVLFTEPVTDQRIYRAFGDILCGELDCIPANVTKNPVAVGFGNTHNATQAYRNETVDTVWIADALEKAKTTALTVAKHRNKEQKHKAKLREHYNKNGGRRGENISEFIDTCDAVAEMVREGLLTPGRGNEYRWHGSENERSCEIFDDGVIHIFSGTMQKFSPAPELEPVNAHRFYLYQLSGLDLSKDSDKAKCREYLFDRGYGSDPKARTRQAPVRLSHQPDYQPENETLDTLREALPVGLLEWQERTAETDRQHMLILAFGAGTGKSTASIINLKQYADISPTLELADEKYGKALFEGVHAMRHRSRNYNRDAAESYTHETVPIGLAAESGAVPCAFPDICNGLAAKGYSASSLFCPACPRYDECRADGYLSQWDLMPKHDAIFFSYQDDFFSDPQYESFIETITKGKDAVLVLDEVDPASLPPKREYITEYLKQLCVSYGSLDAGVFLGMLIEKTAKATTPLDWTIAVKELLAKFQDDDLDAIDIDLEAIPVKTRFEKAQPAVCDLAGVPLYKTIAHITYGTQERTCAVLSRREGEKELPIATFEMLTNDDAKWVSDAIIPTSGWQAGQEYESLLTINTFCKLGFGSLDSTEAVESLPARLSNFTKDLRSFVSSVNSETPACHEDKDGKAHLGWVYYLRPSMNARRGVMISAGGIEDILKEQYAHTEIEIEVMHGKPPRVEARQCAFSGIHWTLYPRAKVDRNEMTTTLQ